MKLKPPPEDKWEELNLYDRCTCTEYEWETICPYSADIWNEECECTCCPYHAQQCAWEI